LVARRSDGRLRRPRPDRKLIFPVANCANCVDEDGRNVKLVNIIANNYLLIRYCKSILLDLYAVTYHAARHYEALICVAKNRTELCANI